MSAENEHEFGCSSIDRFTYVLQGLIRDRWTGKVDMETDSGSKSVHLVKGHFVCATSELLDDRLGEIFYRYGFMSLDELTQTIMKLSGERRIGKIALDDKLLTYNQLWFSLKVQIANVIRSVYLGEEVKYQLKPSDGELGYALVEPSMELINRLKAFHVSFQHFCTVVTDGAILTINPAAEGVSQFNQDMLRIVAKHKQVSEIVVNSRLHPTYTLVCLMEMLADNQCSIDDKTETRWQRLVSDDELQQTIDDYNRIVAAVVGALRRHGCAAMLGEIVSYAHDSVIDCKIIRTLCLDGDATITPLTMLTIHDHCAIDKSQVSRYLLMINSIAKFVSQLAIDVLPTDVSDKLAAVHQFARSA
ncbi:MAG: hypothetical protein OYH77_05540 [Pseudomonadota bacterium]|nr:hypothetical protein [Pseudomonadota bacterium]